MHREKLHQLTETILFSEHPGELRAACRELYEFFSGITGLDDATENEADLTVTMLESGEALSPRDAARCIWDLARTSRFIRGIYAAIIELQQRFPGQRLEVLYAGTGPFAPLVIPILDRFSPDLLRVTFLDIHQRSLAAVAKILTVLEFEDYAAGMVEADATKYKHETPLHLIVCEVLQKVLKKEPQVPATRNLAPQLAEGGVFIPQKISIDACLGNISSEMTDNPRPRIPLGNILTLDADALRQDPDADLPAVTIEIPDADISKIDLLMLTNLQIFGPFVLGDYDSGLSYPTMVRRLPELKTGDRLQFVYVEDGFPRLDCHLSFHKTAV
jgi:hypothetical protein